MSTQLPGMELVATGPESGQGWRRALPTGQTVRLGRSPRNGWAVPWDLRISREHADVVFDGDSLRVKCLETALNVPHHQGEEKREFSMSMDDSFRIGQTDFSLQSNGDDPSTPTASCQPVFEHSYTASEVERFEFGSNDHRLEVLWNLPKIISISRTDGDFAQHLAELLVDGILRAEAAAVLQYDLDGDRETDRPLMMRMAVRGDDAGGIRPSRRLVWKALDTNNTVLHIWSEEGDAKFTFGGSFDWAFCTPIGEKSCRGWALYVCGALSQELHHSDVLNHDVRFAQFIAKVTGAIRQVRMLESQQAGLRQFFSPKVISTLEHDLEAQLAPRECEITALLCDLRGFSLRAERSQHDLRQLLTRCSDALGLMTREILARDGVIADFQGDSALGFWGWPLPEPPISACRAALAILAAFDERQQQPDHPLTDFQVGIGIARGQAMAGKIGTQDQSKVGVFGHPVNLAARLEGLTKHLRAPILLDEATAAAVRTDMPPSEGRLRKIGGILPYGMETPVNVYQLLPPVSSGSSISDDNIREYETAVDAVVDGRWIDALEIFDSLPVADRAKDFLMVYIAKHQYRAPDDWDGVIRMASK